MAGIIIACQRPQGRAISRGAEGGRQEKQIVTQSAKEREGSARGGANLKMERGMEHILQERGNREGHSS